MKYIKWFTHYVGLILAAIVMLSILAVDWSARKVLSWTTSFMYEDEEEKAYWASRG